MKQSQRRISKDIGDARNVHITVQDIRTALGLRANSETDGGDVTLEANEDLFPFPSLNTSGSSTSTQPPKPPVSMARKAGLVFNPIRINKKLATGNYAGKIREAAGIYMAGVLEYLVAEIMEIAGDVAKDNKKKRINPRHIMQAVRMDEELNKLLSNCTISGGGVLPCINPILLQKKTPLHFSKEKLDNAMNNKMKVPKHESTVTASIHHKKTSPIINE